MVGRTLDDNSFADKKFWQFLDSFSNLLRQIFSRELKVGDSMLNDLLSYSSFQPEAKVSDIQTNLTLNRGLSFLPKNVFKQLSNTLNKAASLKILPKLCFLPSRMFLERFLPSRMFLEMVLKCFLPSRRFIEIYFRRESFLKCCLAVFFLRDCFLKCFLPSRMLFKCF